MVPDDTVDQGDIEHEREFWKETDDSSGQDDQSQSDSDGRATSSKEDNADSSGEEHRANASSAGAGAGGGSKWWGRKTRYGDPESDNSDDFIVPG